jgi:hypothetical protein
MSDTAATKYHQRIEKKLDAAIARATPMVLAREFDTAEELVRHAERSLSEHRGVPCLYVNAVAALGDKNASASDRALIRAIFDRLIHRPPNAHPEPHTKEEAERYGQHDAREHERVVKLVGFDPTLWPADPPETAKLASLAGKNATSARKKSTVMFATILTVVAMLSGMIASVTMVVMFLAGAANSDPIAIRQMKWMLASVVLVQFLALGGSSGLRIVARPWLACGAGLFPAVYAVILTTVLIRTEW